MALRLIPMGDRLLAKRVVSFEMTTDPETGHVVTKGGVSVPEEAAERRPEVEVVALSQGPPSTPQDIRPLGLSQTFLDSVKIGDKLLIGENCGQEYQEYLLLYEEEILGKLEDLTEESTH